jgi:hypothetical protein
VSQLLGLALSVFLVGVIIGFARRAKPIGNLPYRWGTYMAISLASASILSFLAAVFVGMDLLFGDLHATNLSERFLDLLFVAVLSGLTSAGLFRRRRYGAVLVVAPTLLLTLIAVLLILTSTFSPRGTVALAPFLIINASFGLSNYLYFRRRWKGLGKPSCPPTVTASESHVQL